jgi:hypothetical protein
MFRWVSAGRHANHRRRAILLICLATHAGLLGWGAARHSPHTDEAGHLVAGLSHWQFGTFRLFHVNPPLVRIVAGLPVWLADPDVDWSGYQDDLGERPEFNIATRFLELNGERAFPLFTIARWACIPFSLAGAVFCYLFARDLWNADAGLIAAALWCYCPNVLAHGQTITPDVAAAAFGLAAAWIYRRWLLQRRFPTALAAGLVLGLALLCKTTWIFLLALWPAVWIIDRLVARKQPPPHFARWSHEALQQALILVVALLTINACYAFEGSFRKLGDYEFQSMTLAGDDAEQLVRGRQGNRFRTSWAAAIPVPFPANYVAGIDRTKYEFENRRWSYLAGEWRFGGWWYYYLYAAAIKVPLGAWLLLLSSLCLPLLKRGYALRGRYELLVLLIPLLVFTLVSSQTGYNHHLRYVLPAFPFGFVWASRLGLSLQLRQHWVTGLALLCLSWSTGSSLWFQPHHLSYFNELAGGPAQGHYYLGGGEGADSNIDWGQDLLYLKRWLDQHPQARPMHIAFLGICQPEMAGIEYLPVPRGPGGDGRDLSLPVGPVPGWYAISVKNLHTRERTYDYFQSFPVHDRVGYSVYIYHITLVSANRVRQSLGLPLLLDDASDSTTAHDG